MGVDQKRFNSKAREFNLDVNPEESKKVTLDLGSVDENAEYFLNVFAVSKYDAPLVAKGPLICQRRFAIGKGSYFKNNVVAKSESKLKYKVKNNLLSFETEKYHWRI